jgi:hypothetical protein
MRAGQWKRVAAWLFAGSAIPDLSEGKNAVLSVMDVCMAGDKKRKRNKKDRENKGK